MPDGLPPLILPQLPHPVRRPERSSSGGEPRLRRRALLAVALAHVLLGVMLDRAMRIREAAPRMVVDDAVLIRWIASEPLPEDSADESLTAMQSSLEPPVASPAAQSPRPVAQRSAPRLSVPMTAPMAVDGTSTAPPADIDTARLFNPDGSLRMSTQVVDAAQPARAAPEFKTPQLPTFVTPRSPVPYRRTQFDAVWVPDGENLRDEIFRNVVVEKEFQTPWGTRWRCAWILIIGGCADVPPPLVRIAPRAAWETYEPEPEDPERELEF